MVFKFFSYLLIRLLLYPMGFFSYPTIHKIGAALGLLAYHLMPKFRKRALSNLSIAKKLQLNEQQIVKFAKQSFQNLMITCLEYPKLAKEKNLHEIAVCMNPEKAVKIMQDGNGIIFFCGHQANWEILFLEGTSRMPGVAIGRPIKNTLLYQWILSIRQKFGGKIITPVNAIKEGLRALKRKQFLGIVGDQGMPNSGYCSPFLGAQAWTSPVPAILSYRTGNPVIVATTLRKEGKYHIHYSDPIWPNVENSQEQEVGRMMKIALDYLEQSIMETPGQWLWQHNRWKQQTPDRLKSIFRQESLCIILPEALEEFKQISEQLPVFREIYPFEFITLMVPENFKEMAKLDDAELRTYNNINDLLVRDFRYKLIFNFTDHAEVRRHFLKLSAFQVFNLKRLKHIANGHKNDDFTSILKKAVFNAS